MPKKISSETHRQPVDAFNLMQWLERQQSLLKGPFTNKVIWEHADLMVIMAVGPHRHVDYHVDPFEEFFYQLTGETELNLVLDGRLQTKVIRQGDVLLLPSLIPHSPQRPDKSSVTLVVERRRPEGVMDAFEWYCTNCHQRMFRREIHRSHFEEHLPGVFEAYNCSVSSCSACGASRPSCDT